MFGTSLLKLKCSTEWYNQGTDMHIYVGVNNGKSLPVMLELLYVQVKKMIAHMQSILISKFLISRQKSNNS